MTPTWKRQEIGSGALCAIEAQSWRRLQLLSLELLVHLKRGRMRTRMHADGTKRR